MGGKSSKERKENAGRNTAKCRRLSLEGDSELLRSQRENDELRQRIAELENQNDAMRNNVTPNEQDQQVEGSETTRNETATSKRKQDKIFATAIDFGTSYSGFGFSTLGREVHLTAAYFEQEPTVVLIDCNRQFHSFGKKAKEHYAKQVENKTEQEWYFFEHFKMKLFTQSGTLDKDMVLTDATGKEMPALDIFTAVIKYMVDTFLDSVRYLDDYTVDRIHFILTIPAIWNDLAKTLMRQAAIKAGIPDDSLTLALEPEAASLYCRDKMSDILKTPGTGYIVADLGGGTADFTCHEVNADGTLKELHMPVGGDFGGTAIDNAFRNLLNKIFGADIIHKFKTNDLECYFELFDTFETKKRTFDGSQHLVFCFPNRLLEIFEDQVGQSVTETLRASDYSGHVIFKPEIGKVAITCALAKNLFDTAVTKIVDKIQELLCAVPNVQFLLLVGGFSNSPYLRDILKETFDQKDTYNDSKLKVIFFQDSEWAVVKGAVIYGLQPTAIESRVCKYTYGIAKMMRFKSNHSLEKRIEVNGVAWCDGLFNKHIEVGTAVRVGDEYPPQEYFPITEDMKHAVLEVYASTEKNPTYVDDPGCQFVGLIKINLTGGDLQGKVLIKLMFGGTELRNEAVEEKTGNITVGYVDCLG